MRRVKLQKSLREHLGNLRFYNLLLYTAISQQLYQIKCNKERLHIFFVFFAAQITNKQKAQSMRSRVAVYLNGECQWGYK